ncbi:hypothetical protein N9W02_03565 [Flavobacteriaceae bacterium]|jgi:hypothetical protein|nr:hypothetical protein [Flavobacteriaceae bacterium]
MRKKFLSIIAICFFGSLAQGQTIFELDASQSMLMYGKGPGQDGTINPFEGQDCFAIVKNFGKELFSARLQKNGAILQIIEIPEGQSKRIKLPVGVELYLDTETKTKAMASVEYEKAN